jgi:DDE superfamily endonuclease
MNYQKIRTNKKQFLSITSLTVEKFDELFPIFKINWEEFINNFALDGLPRVRVSVPSEKEFLPKIEEKLFFILAYQKNAALQEFFAASFDTDQANCNKYIHILSPILDKSLEDYKPKRKIEEVAFSELSTYVIDATERAVQRDTYHQEAFYSGKKKRHTVKNMAICSTLGALIFLSPTVVGKIHDKTLIETFEITKKNISFLADLAFLNWNPSENITVVLPHKKPRNTKKEKKELTQEQKEYNRKHSIRRVVVENVFARLKTMRILKDTIRNYKENFKDLVIQTAAALCNFRKSIKIKNCTF